VDRQRDKQDTNIETLSAPAASAPETGSPARGKAAFVALAGRPSSGKSTLLNALCGAKVSITSPVPQTTRNSIRGIVNRKQGQLVFIDTPGIHISGKKFNLRLLARARRALEESDLAAYILDSSRPPGAEEERIAAMLNALPPQTLGARTVALINKSDLSASKKGAAKAVREFLAEKLPLLPKERIFSISALKKINLEPVLDTLFALAPEGPPFYDAEFYTDQDVRFRICEIVREKTINTLREELPHSVFVEAESLTLKDGELSARIIIRTERESQKGIVIGEGGKNIGKIRVAALKELEALFDWKIRLELHVKTAPGWRGNDKILKKLM